VWGDELQELPALPTLPTLPGALCEIVDDARHALARAVATDRP